MQQALTTAAAVTNEQRLQRACRVAAGAMEAIGYELDPDDEGTEWFRQVADGLRCVGGLPPRAEGFRPVRQPARLHLVRETR